MVLGQKRGQSIEELSPILRTELNDRGVEVVKSVARVGSVQCLFESFSEQVASGSVIQGWDSDDQASALRWVQRGGQDKG